jgi:perosamine synthetase
VADDFIPLCVPALRGNELAYLRECVETNWVSYAGPFVPRFEAATAAYVGSPHAVATNSGTAALHIALQLAGVGVDDEVLVSDLTFIAPANAIRYCGAHPVFFDAEPAHWQMNADDVRAFLETGCSARDGRLVNRKTGRRIAALMPVHILGHPVDMDPLLELAARFELPLIEDATEALGARYRGRATGAMGQFGCFSYNGNKLITTGGGGMLVTANAEMARRAKHLTTQAKCSEEEYFHDAVGYNYRLTNLQAAVGVAQMEQLENCITAKRAIAHRYEQALADVPGITPPREAPWAFSTYWMYTVLVDEAAAGISSRELMRRLAAQRIQTRPLWGLLHEQPPYQRAQAYRIREAPRLFAGALSFPCSVGLDEAQQGRVIAAVLAIAGRRDRVQTSPRARTSFGDF